MNYNIPMWTEDQERRALRQGPKVLPSTVLSFAAPLQAGKTTVSISVAHSLQAPWVSFGAFLRGLARKTGMDLTREALQTLGDQLVTQDVRSFCENVLAQQACETGKPLIIDGVRHVEVLDSLNEILSPARGYLIYINVDRETQAKRFNTDQLPHTKTLDELEQHPTERQVRSRLSDRAALVLDGTLDPHESTRIVVEFLAAREKEAEGRSGDEKNGCQSELAEKRRGE